MLGGGPRSEIHGPKQKKETEPRPEPWRVQMQTRSLLPIRKLQSRDSVAAVNRHTKATPKGKHGTYRL